MAGRLIVLYRDNFGSNGLTLVHSQPYLIDPQRTNWTTLDLTTANLGNYEPVIDEARWDLDNQLHIVYQPSEGQGYVAPMNTAAEIGVLEWDAATYFNHRPALAISSTNFSHDLLLRWPSQIGWSYRVQTSSELRTWTNVATFFGTGGKLQCVATNSSDSARFWRLEIREGGFAP
jgi:hypothetical protein